MILCAGLSPAWQHTLFFDRFSVGEVNRAKRGVWCASGKVVNAAAALGSLGVEHKMLTVVGGAPEAAFHEDLKTIGVDAELIPVQSPTRVCTTILAEGQATTELVEECGPVTVVELARFEERLDELLDSASGVVISGSLPKGTDPRIWRRVLDRRWERGWRPAVLDIRGLELLEALPARPYLVKPNREELATTFGRSLSSEADVIEAGRELCRRGARWALVTQGAGPALLIDVEHAERVHGPIVDAVNPIGCGDTLAAAVAWRMAQCREFEPRAVIFGVAAAAANAETELPARFSGDRVAQLLPSVRWETV